MLCVAIYITMCISNIFLKFLRQNISHTKTKTTICKFVIQSNCANTKAEKKRKHLKPVSIQAFTHKISIQNKKKNPYLSVEICEVGESPAGSEGVLGERVGPLRSGRSRRSGGGRPRRLCLFGRQRRPRTSRVGPGGRVQHREGITAKRILIVLEWEKRKRC